MRHMTIHEDTREICDAIQDEAESWMVRLRSSGMSDADLRSFQAWRSQSPAHERAVLELEQLWSTMLPVATCLARERMTHGRQAAVAVAQHDRQLRIGRRAMLGGALAVAVGWLAWRPPLDLWPSVEALASDYHTGPGEQRQLMLSDVVKVEMNTRTRVNVSHDAGGTNIVLLDGEAEFVTAGRGGMAGTTVVVSAGSGQLLPEQARFTVRHDPGHTTVCCLEGRVMVRHLQRQWLLEQGRQLAYTQDTVSSPAPIDPQTAAPWRKGMLVFEDQRLADVVSELNRYRAGRIILRNPALANRRVQLQLPIAQLDEVIDMIRELYGVQVSQWPGGVVLLS